MTHERERPGSYGLKVSRRVQDGIVSSFFGTQMKVSERLAHSIMFPTVCTNRVRRCRGPAVRHFASTRLLSFHPFRIGMFWTVFVMHLSQTQAAQRRYTHRLRSMHIFAAKGARLITSHVKSTNTLGSVLLGCRTDTGPQHLQTSTYHVYKPSCSPFLVLAACRARAGLRLRAAQMGSLRKGPDLHLGAS